MFIANINVKLAEAIGCTFVLLTAMNVSFDNIILKIG